MKKVLSIFLSLVLIFSTLTFVSIPAGAEVDDLFEVVGTITGESVIEGIEITGAYYDEAINVNFYDYKYYKIFPEESGWYYFEFNSEFNPYVVLYDSEGECLAESYDGFVDDKFSLNYYFNAGETYYLSFTTWEYQDTVIDVTVLKSEAPTEDVFEVVDTITGEGIIEDVEIAPSYYDEEIEDFVYDYKYYKFIPDTSGWYLFETYTEFDTGVFLYDAWGNLLELSFDKFIDNYNFSLNYEFVSGETYYLEFSTFDEEDVVFDVIVLESTEDYAPVWTEPEYEQEFLGEGEFDFSSKLDVYGYPIYQIIKYIPVTSGRYTFTSEEQIFADVVGVNGQYIDFDFDEQRYEDFCIFEEGETYYLYVKAFENGTLTIDNIDTDGFDEIEEPTEPSTEPSSSEAEPTEPSIKDPFEIAGTITGAGVIENVEIAGAYYDENYYEDSGAWILEYRCYKFIPEKSDWFLFESNTDFDPYIEIYDVEGDCLADSEDVFINNNNFSLNYYFEEGETYYIYLSTREEQDIIFDVMVLESTEDYAPIWNPEYYDVVYDEGEFKIIDSESINNEKILKFIPSITGNYIFTFSNADDLVSVFDENSFWAEMNWQDGKCYYPLEEGKTYYLFITAHDGDILIIDNTDNNFEVPTEPSSSTQPSSSETEPTEPSSEEPIPTVKPTESTTQPTVKPSSTQKPDNKPSQPVVCVHTTILKNAKDATYFAAGYTGDTTCVKCGVVTAKGKAIAKLTLKTPSFKLTKGKKQFKVKYTAVSSATGFQVKYKLKGKWKTKTYSSTKTVTKAIKKLKKGKYSVQVRAFAEQNGVKVYSAWSKTKKVKVK